MSNVKEAEPVVEKQMDIIELINYFQDEKILDTSKCLTLRRGVGHNRAFASIVLHLFMMLFKKFGKLEAELKIMQDRQSPFSEDKIEPVKNSTKK